MANAADFGGISYGEPTHWDTYYTECRQKISKNHKFDWYCKLDKAMNGMWAFLETIPEEKRFNQRILILGCGSAEFSEDLYKLGYKNQTNIDISSICINQMQERYRGYEGMEHIVMDIRRMNSLSTNYYDLILDKGTLDCLFSSFNFYNDVPLALSEIFRVMRPGGMFMCMSHGGKEGRHGYFTGTSSATNYPPLKWTVDATILSTGLPDIMLYVCKKCSDREWTSIEKAKPPPQVSASEATSNMKDMPGMTRKKEDAGRIILRRIRDPSFPTLKDEIDELMREREKEVNRQRERNLL